MVPDTGRLNPAATDSRKALHECLQGVLLLCLIFLVGCGDREAGTRLASPPGGIPPTPWPAVLPSVLPSPTVTIARRPPSDLTATPLVEIVSPAQGTVSRQNPAFLEIELVGPAIVEVSQYAGLQEEEGRVRLLSYKTMGSGTGDGTRPVLGRPGVHELFWLWSAEGDFLATDGGGEWVLTQPAVDHAGRLVVAGLYRPAASDSFMAASLSFDVESGQLAGAIDEATGLPLPVEPDDHFQVSDWYLSDMGIPVAEPGPIMPLGQAPQLRHEVRPLPPGDYLVGIRANAVSGETAASHATIRVGTDQAVPGYEVYLDAEDGFQFLYPATWTIPTYEGGRLITVDAAHSTLMSVTRRPLADIGSVHELKKETLRAFGDVSVLFEDRSALGGNGGLWTAYGYDGPAGPRVGVFVTTVRDGRGYVIDVDGPAAQETALLETVRIVTDSWMFRPVGKSSRNGQWRIVNLGSLQFAAPAQFEPETLDNGWHRFADRNSTGQIALLVHPSSGTGLDQALQQWLRTAQVGVDDWLTSDGYAVELGEQEWLRVDVAYTSSNGVSMLGFIMLTALGSDEVVAWAEAPAALYDRLEQDIFTIMLSDIGTAE